MYVNKRAFATGKGSFIYDKKYAPKGTNYDLAETGIRSAKG